MEYRRKGLLDKSNSPFLYAKKKRAEEAGTVEKDFRRCGL